ncbi:PAS domain S-box-containing protein/diguanylate cyclase (GGDEF)-like protein [Vreelandella songnenensis]|uniref:PAS domain S-box-containing protein/diguanylate cyclase (GGDEF)-like protein n=1 Tax=Vreelandella songnenensis TaxID=1176243 RepID=A0A2T0V862_9GAMM|nr:diguanylate cyclase [Halomonas songnenensis]PRY66307.1 PAS domain S-box-containing protein/diguanylate cyclase (GGDEF)-like protein [Halomonas songnenensis]
MSLSFLFKKLPFFRTLKGRLLLGLLVTLLTLVAFLLGLAWQVGKTMVLETNMTHLRYEARLLADEVTQQVELRFQALQRLSEIVGYSDDPEWLSYELRHNGTLMSWFDGIVVMDRNGYVVADWPSVVGRVGLDTSESEFFKMVRGTRQPHMSEPFIGRASKMPMVVVSVPRLDDRGEFAGMIGGVLSLDSGGLFNRLAKVRLGEEGYAGVATASGNILYHPISSLINTRVSSEVDNPLLHQALDGWQGDGVGELVNGQVGLQSYAQVWPANWVIGLFLPNHQAQLPLAGFIRQLAWMWLLLAILIMPLLWWILARILTPLNHLETQIGEVGLGKRQSVDLATSMQELQQVASTFNRVEGERQSLVEHLHERQAFLDTVLSAVPQGMFVADFDGAITYMNPALLGMLGISSDWTMGALLDQIHDDDRNGARDMWQYSLSSGSDFVRQLRFTRLDQEVLWLDIHARVVLLTQGGHSLGLVGVVKDVTERRQQEALQRWEAEHDPLTGLLNRRGFERRLEEAFADFQKTSTPSALLMFDLDHFKPINDEGGHALGDEMLRRIAQIIAWEVRRSDHVARQGGDEFGVLLPSCTLSQAQLIAESLRQAVSEVSVTNEGKEYRVTLSMGVTSFNDNDSGIDDALSRADAASYDAKSLGRDSVVVNVPDEIDPMTIFD